MPKNLHHIGHGPVVLVGHRPDDVENRPLGMVFLGAIKQIRLPCRKCDTFQGMGHVRDRPAALGRDGSIDWLAVSHFDSAACFAALLGDSENGRWKIAPKAGARITRRYREGTLILETRFEIPEGAVTLVDCMGRRDGCADLVRLVRGEQGRVQMRMELVIRCEYGSIIPWVRRLDDGRHTAVAGPDRLTLSTPIKTHGENLRTVAEFRFMPARRSRLF